jgi:hypothetical protein
MRAVERGEGVEQRGDRAADHHAHDDAAAHQAVDVVDGLADRTRGGQRRARVLEGGRAGGRHRRRAARAVDERGAELALELADLRADAGLADVNALGGAGEVRLLGDGDEVLQLPELHTQRF